MTLPDLLPPPPLTPPELSSRLRFIIIGGVIGTILLFVAIVSTTVINLQHTSQTVGTVSSLLKRGDCRALNVADFNNDLAQLLQESVRAKPDQSKIKTLVDGMADSAEAYKECATKTMYTTTTDTRPHRS